MDMKIKQKFWLPLLSAGLLLAGCSGTRSVGQLNTYDSSAKTAEAASMDVMDESGSDGGPAIEEPGDVLQAYGGEDGLTWGSSDQENAIITYTASLSIQTRDYQKSWQAIADRIKELKGFLVSENQYGDGANIDSGSYKGPTHGYYEVKIPADQLDNFLNTASDFGSVTDSSKNAQNIKKSYNSVKDRIEFLEAQQKRLKEMLNEAQSLSDILDIEKQQMEVEQELKGYQEQKNQMDLDKDYSTVYIYLDQVQVLSQTGDSFADKVSNAFGNTWFVLLDGLEAIVVFLIYLLPWAILALILFFAIRWFLRRRKEKKAAGLAAGEKRKKEEQNPKDAKTDGEE